jgi:hypothetical protein
LSDLSKLWTTSSNISTFVLSKSFFWVNIGLVDQLLLTNVFENFDF